MSDIAEVSHTPYYSPGELVLVKHRHGERTFWAYYALFDLIQEPAWWRPRRFLWWKWEDWYWKHELSPVEPHQFRSRP